MKPYTVFHFFGKKHPTLPTMQNEIQTTAADMQAWMRGNPRNQRQTLETFSLYQNNPKNPTMQKEIANRNPKFTISRNS